MHTRRAMSLLRVSYRALFPTVSAGVPRGVVSSCPIFPVRRFGDSPVPPAAPTASSASPASTAAPVTPAAAASTAPGCTASLDSVPLKQIIADLKLSASVAKALDSHGITAPSQLTALRAQAFLEVVPDLTARNLLKAHLRVLAGRPLAADSEPCDATAAAAAVAADASGAAPAAAVAGKAATMTASTSTTTTSAEGSSSPAAAAAAAAASSSGVGGATTTTTTTTTTATASAATATASAPADAAAPSPVPAAAAEVPLAAAEHEAAELTVSTWLEPLKMPKFFDDMKDGVITEWHVKVGEMFDRGAPICDIETDIAEITYDAAEPGYLNEIVAPVGTKVAIGEPIAVRAHTEMKD